MRGAQRGEVINMKLIYKKRPLGRKTSQIFVLNSLELNV